MNLYKASKVAVWENFGSRLFNLRTECAVTQKMVGDAIGVTASYIGLLERGVRNPNFAVVVSLSKYFGVSIQTFLGES
jgi:transcriptional regulator with XRE-family HTH domain